MTMHNNIGGVWKQVSDPECNIGGVWKKITDAWCNIAGVWKKFFSRSMPLYTNGVKNVAWQKGDVAFFYGGTASYTEYGTYIQLSASGKHYDYEDWPADANAVTAGTIDVTNFKTLKVDCTVTVTSVTGGTPRWDINVSTGQMTCGGPFATDNLAYVSYTETAVVSERQQTVSLDISSISGTGYIKIDAVSPGSSCPITVKINKVWLE